MKMREASEITFYFGYGEIIIILEKGKYLFYSQVNVLKTLSKMFT